jgi:hypothetical protein
MPLFTGLTLGKYEGSSHLLFLETGVRTPLFDVRVSKHLSRLHSRDHGNQRA